MTEEIKKGSLGISVKAHETIVNLVYDGNEPSQDRPFVSIVEGFRFAFALGYSKSIHSKKTGKHVTVAPRQFVVDDYLEILREEAISKDQSLGGLISEYAEAGCIELEKIVVNGDNVMNILNL
tara:strand:+ start:32 stop:400 length:369 start_codon:yes stop_codon:yes gene_type:complete